MTATLTKTFHFEAAHTLPRVPADHQCARMHGHSYRVEVSVTGPVGADSGWVMDHAEIGAAVKPLMATLDHRYLNDIPGLENPTFENIAVWLWERLKSSLPMLSEISVHETPTSRCVYRG